METTFITIHDLSLDARVLYSSDSILDILGFSPQEVVGKSCWEYFHPDELPFAKSIHGRGVQLDKAAVLNYCQLKNRYGQWVGCECVFTIVHDVMVGCTSIYRRGAKSQKRAADAPVVRQLFSSSPRDPRYHMLAHISSKFKEEIKPRSHEPRAALFLNRFTRTLPIVYATNGMSEILGIDAEELTGKSFYYCIQENCLHEAVRCLESAKANDSIAYLRFWYRDPRQGDPLDHDVEMGEAPSPSSEEDDDDGGVHLKNRTDSQGDLDVSRQAVSSDSSVPHVSSETHSGSQRADSAVRDHNTRSTSGDSTDVDGITGEAIFDPPANNYSSSSSISTPDEEMNPQEQHENGTSAIELEAVVSCTSDGLVVVLRRARSILPQILHDAPPSTMQETYANGLFASPWAADPILPDIRERSQSGRRTNLLSSSTLVQSTAAQANELASRGVNPQEFMNSIREVAVFAWALTGINGSLDQYSRGKPLGEAQPPGMSIWDPECNIGPEPEPFTRLNDTLKWEANGSNSYQDNRQPGANSNFGQIPEADGYSRQQFGDPKHNQHLNGHSKQAVSFPGRDDHAWF